MNKLDLSTLQLEAMNEAQAILTAFAASFQMQAADEEETLNEEAPDGEVQSS